jgi:hypothetical protein
MAEIWPDPEESGWNPAILVGSGQMCSLESGNGDSCIFSFRNFFVRTKRLKIFSRKLFFFENDFVEIFYDGNHFTSKQTED